MKSMHWFSALVPKCIYISNKLKRFTITLWKNSFLYSVTVWNSAHSGCNSRIELAQMGRSKWGEGSLETGVLGIRETRFPCADRSGPPLKCKSFISTVIRGQQDMFWTDCNENKNHTAARQERQKISLSQAQESGFWRQGPGVRALSQSAGAALLTFNFSIVR